MTENYVQLKKDNILRLGIKTADGIDTGDVLEFDLDDIELPLRYQELLEIIKKNHSNLKNQLAIIEKRQDVKGKKLMSKNQEDTIVALNEFYKKQVVAYDMFLGEGGVDKLLHGRKLGWTTLREIDELIEKQILPYYKVSAEDIKSRIKNLYAPKKEEENVLE